MNSKRNFLKSLLLTATLPLTVKAKNIMDELPVGWTKEETDDYWQTIRNDYKLKPDYINLENGYYSIMSQPVLNGYLKDLQTINMEGSYYMRTVQYEYKHRSKERLATLLGCSGDELIITRNTTESLDTIISGIDWKAGDEAIMAEQDYGSMLDMFKQQANRYGMVNKLISLPLNPKSDDEIIKLYENAITSKTKLIMICHMINITGQILPVKKICDMAHSKGVEVMVDGAHAVSHIDFKISELNCDYYGSSLHKWLGVPLGVGILYVKKEKIKQIWPLFGEYGFKEDEIRKLNHTGTISVASDIAINHAIDYNNAMGIKRKEDRLRFLQNYWTSKIKEVKNIQLNTPTDPQRSCAIANVGIEDLKPSELAKILLHKYKIWTVAIDTSNVHGVRITPHVYTTTNELDKFVKALKEIAKLY
jgi:selenocysteine lyase/cysteine desulfurase